MNIKMLTYSVYSTSLLSMIGTHHENSPTSPRGRPGQVLLTSFDPNQRVTLASMEESQPYKARGAGRQGLQKIRKIFGGRTVEIRKTLSFSRWRLVVTGTFFYFPIYWEFHHPNRLIFFRRVETTNQTSFSRWSIPKSCSIAVFLICF